MSGAAMGVTVLPWEDEADVTARLHGRIPVLPARARNGHQDH